MHQVHERMLFAPLGLRHTWFPGRSQPLDPAREPMMLRAGGKPLHIPMLIESVQGIYRVVPGILEILREIPVQTA